MKQFSSFVIKEAKHIVRDRRTMLILFVMPVVLMLIFGFAISNDVRNVRAVVVTSQMDHVTQQVIDRLSHSEYFVITATVGTSKEAEQLIRRQKADMAVVFSKDMKSAYNFVPAIMGMLLMLICAMMTSVSIVREKEKGTMEVLLVSPVRPIKMIVAKAVPYLVLAFAILVSILLMARFVLGVPLAGSILWIFVVSAIYILLALSLGLLISNIASSQLMALLLSAMVLLMPIVMLSGMLFPIESMPMVLQWISAVIPPRYYIEAMRKLMIMGVGIGEVMREVAILSGMTIFLLIVSLAKFKTRLE